MKSLVIIFVISLYHHCIVREAYGEGERERLVEDTLKNYLPRSLSIPGNISLTISLLVINLEYDPNSKLLTVTAWESYSWRDERLSWDPEAYGGVKEMHLPTQYIWTPDVMLYNGYEDSHRRSEVNAIIKADGNVMWMPPSVFKRKCRSAKSREIPEGATESHDLYEISCSLKFGSWTYGGTKIQLVTDSDWINLSMYEPSSEFDLIEVGAKVKVIYYQGLDEPYPEYQATIKLKYWE